MCEGTNLLLDAFIHILLRLKILVTLVFLPQNRKPFAAISDFNFNLEWQGDFGAKSLG
jgi:hypothetical protein